MKILGKPNQVVRPIIRANGVSTSSVSIEMMVGDIANCMFTVPPESSSEFEEYGKEVTLKVEGDAQTGDLFKGVVAGSGFVEKHGSVQYRVDILHKAARDLDSSTTIIPGHFPGSIFDHTAWIKPPENQSAKGVKSKTHLDLDMSQDFWKETKDGIIHYINSSGTSATSMKSPPEKDKIIAALNLVDSKVGTIGFGSSMSQPISRTLTEYLKAGSTSSTFWNVLSMFLAELDLLLVCKPDGGLLLLPNYTGIAGDGNTFIPASYIENFSYGAKYDRTPSKVVMLVYGAEKAEAMGLGCKPISVGEYEVKGSIPSASGVFTIGLPGFMRGITRESQLRELKTHLDAYAEMVAVRETGKFMTMVISSPLAMGVFPGIPCKFSHLSHIKSFSGDYISPGGQLFDGYCYRISHSIDPGEGSAPITRFHFNCVTPLGFSKPTKHAFWPSAKMPHW